MKTVFKFFTPVAIFLCVATGAFATNGMRMIGFGPVQNSMGGISVAVPLDAATIITNPAGMSNFKARIDFGATYFVPAVEHKGTGAFTAQNSTVESDRGASPVPAFGLVIPINDTLRFGIGAYGISGMGVDYKNNVYMSALSTSYSQMRFAPGLSYKINDMVSVGAVVNVMYATMEFSAATSMGQEAHMNASSFGYGATVGVLVKPFEMVNAGIAYETKSKFQDFEFNTNAGKDKIEFNQPQSVTGGVAVMPVDGLTLAFEIQWIQWSDTNGKNLPEYTKNNSSATPWNLNWDDQLVYKVGAQYALSPMFTVRAGFNYGKMPLDKARAFENVAFPAVAEYHYTAGIGITFNNNLTLNVGGMYSPEATLKGSNAAQFISSYETSMSQYSLDMGIAYTF